MPYPYSIESYGVLTVELRVKCWICYRLCEIAIPVDEYETWKTGLVSIQTALPSVPASDRELLISGTCSECFDKMWPDDEDDEEENAEVQRGRMESRDGGD